MMEYQKCFAQLHESSAWYAGEHQLDNNSREQFFYDRCPICGQLYYCKRIMVITNMEIKEAVQEAWGDE